MSRKYIRLGWLTVILCGSFGIWLYLTHFYYKKTAYTLAAFNGTATPFRDVAVELSPEGRERFGVLEPGQKAEIMDPRWPLPSRLTISFFEENYPNKKQTIELATGLPDAFKGDLVIVIDGTSDAFKAHLDVKVRK